MSKKRSIIIVIVILVFLIAILLSNFYYKGKYSVAFETGTEDEILTKYVSKNTKVKEPSSPLKEGYVFIEWQLNGEKYDFDSEVVENIVLTAKWIKEEYITISYETDSNEIIESDKILKGSSINNLPHPNKEGYEFIGWYLNDNLYNNEILNSDTTLIAKYKDLNNEFNLNDRVLIIGSYAESSYSIISYHTKAIGWDRYIIDIIEDSNYPYVVGNSTGITGFFKSSSLKLLKYGGLNYE